MDHANDNYFQVAVKGLFRNEAGNLLMIQDEYGIWGVPGGRIQKGEDLIECLKRECLEEMGIGCQVVDAQPSIVYPAIDKEGRGRMMLFYKIMFPHFNFTKSNECIDLQFFSKERYANLPMYPQMKSLINFL